MNGIHSWGVQIISKMVKAVIADIDAVDQNFTVHAIVEVRDEVANGGLTAAYRCDGVVADFGNAAYQGYLQNQN